MEPTPQDLAAVSEAIGGQPAQQQPAAPTPQPSPQSQPADPFLAFSQTPTETVAPPAEPEAQPVAPAEPPVQPAEPVAQPEAQPVAQPVAPPVAPPTESVVQPAQPTETLSVEQYMDEIFGTTPAIPDMPDPAQVNPDSPEGIQQFFTDLMTTAEQRFEAKAARNNAIQTAEKRAWEDAFDKYGSLRSNTQLRDMVHAIRMNEFNRGVAISPTQAAERLLGALQQQYRQGVADNQVVTTIEQTQPVGGSSTPVQTTADKDKALLAVQHGGEAALAQILDAQFKAQG